MPDFTATQVLCPFPLESVPMPGNAEGLHMTMMRKAFGYAVVGSVERANSIGPILGGLIVWGAMRSLRLPMAISDDIGGTLGLLLATVGSAWLIIVVVRFLYRPWSHLKDFRKLRPATISRGAAAEWHMYGDLRSPKILSGPEDWPWYFLLTTVIQKNAETSALEQRVIASTLFLSFKAPTDGISFQVYSPDISLPTHEVKFFSATFAVIAFEGPVPMGTLGIKLI
jgi:hypothetical protein